MNWSGQRVAALLGLTLLSSCIVIPPPPADTGSLTAGSYEHAAGTVANKLLQRNNIFPARGVVLFIGDGMSLATVSAGRIYVGQSLEKKGEEHELSFESFPHVGLAKTYNTNQQTPDSAGTMTAMLTGSKTRAGMLSIGPAVDRGSAEHCHQHHLSTLLELAETAGWRTGIVTNTTVTHATPAAGYAHSAERNWESDADMPQAAKDNGCKDIAQQFIDFNHGDGIDVLLGGGSKNFMPKPKGKREDGKNLVDQWRTAYPEGVFVSDKEALLNTKFRPNNKLLGLFSSSHMEFEFDRRLTQQPSLSTMATVAYDLLSQSKNFLLIVESGRIDHAHHFGNAFRALDELAEFDRTINAINQRANPLNSLLIVTADHSHTLSFGGYPARGNPILGFVKSNDSQGHPKTKHELAADGKPYTTLSYANGPGHCEHYGNEATEGFQPCHENLRNQQRVNANDHPTHANFQQNAMVPLYTETHAGDDVPIYAKGPWAHLLDGVVEQNVIFHVIKHATGL